MTSLSPASADADEGTTAPFVWGIGTSRTMRAHWALCELGLEYGFEPIRPRTPAMEEARFLAVNPRGKVPVLVDGDMVLAESAAIIAWLGATRDPGGLLVPGEPAGRAHYDSWCSFVTMEIDATSLYVIRRHGELSALYGEAPQAVRCAGEYFARQIGHIEDALGDGRAFLLGDRFSGVDILLHTCLPWARRYDLPLPDATDAYRRRLSGRPAYRAALARNHPESDRAPDWKRVDSGGRNAGEGAK